MWQNYIALRNIENLFKRKRAFDSLKADFYQYVISIPSNTKNMPPMMFGEIGYIEQSVLGDYYDNKTGFIVEDTKSIVIW